MKTVHVVLDLKLLEAADAAAKRRKLNRSAFMRAALLEHLQREKTAQLEERDRRGYAARPQQKGEFKIWEDVAAWPDD